MTARGARAQGQNVYLWKNEDNSYEYIPAEGATGGAAVYYNHDGTKAGIQGNNGSSRQTGGGGSGTARHWINASRWSGAGAKGTSYSGGTGGGANDVRHSYLYNSGPGEENGGTGGYAYASWSSRHGATGGTGNPGGEAYVYEGATGSKGTNGTGGLLIIYSNEMENYGTISSDGTMARTHYYSSGGSSGGGTVNIFYNKNCENSGNVTANGGIIANPGYGGAGGNGCVTIGSILSKNYEEREKDN